MLTSGRRDPSGLRIEAALYGTTPVHYGDLVLLSGELQARLGSTSSTTAPFSPSRGSPV